jgi:hypothetical protein
MLLALPDRIIRRGFLTALECESDRHICRYALAQRDGFMAGKISGDGS